MLNLLTGLNNNDAYIRGFRTLECGRPYHTPHRTQDVCKEIYQHLINGKIVILDLSVGQAQLRERISKRIESIFDYTDEKRYLCTTFQETNFYISSFL